MQFLPIFLDIRGRRALVLGTGEAAQRKAGALRRAGAEVTLAANFTPGLLDDCAIAVGADAPLADLESLSKAAQSRGIPVNVVDRPALCSFITPAIVDRDPVIVAISSGGAAPVLARLIRARIEAMLPPALARLASLAGSLSTELRSRFPGPEARRRVIERMLTGRAADLVLAGDEPAGLAEMRREIGQADTKPPGIVYLLDAPTAPDLLTLRAHRILGEADVIVHDSWVLPAILDMARRDAQRIDAADATDLLIRLAQEGKRVIRLGHAEAAVLVAAGIRTERVPGSQHPGSQYEE